MRLKLRLCASLRRRHGGQALVRARVGHRYADTGQSIASVKMPGFSANDRVDDEVLEGTSVINGVPLAISAIPV